MQSFYPAHEDVCRAALLPAMRAHLAWLGSLEDPVDATAVLVADHCRESQRQLRLVLETDPEDVPMTLESTLRAWETDRADRAADVLLKDAVQHVRSL
jgi:hypothetical protein